MQEGGKEQAKQKVVVPWSEMAALKMVRNGIYLKHRAPCFSHAFGVKPKLETIITDEVTGEQSETNLWDTKCESNRIQESEEPVWDWTAGGSGMIPHLGGSRSKDGDKHHTYMWQTAHLDSVMGKRGWRHPGHPEPDRRVCWWGVSGAPWWKGPAGKNGEEWALGNRDQSPGDKLRGHSMNSG